MFGSSMCDLRGLAPWRKLFAIDLRSLAAFRIGIAATILIDVIWRAWYADPFFTDDGILPRVVRIELVEPNDPRGFDCAWSLHLYNGQWWAQIVLLILAGVAAAWLLVGYRSQLAVLACWILQLSIDNRNPMLHDAGDAVLRSLVFWGLFLPLGARWSLDSVRRGAATVADDESTLAGTEPAAVVTFGSAAILLQLLAVYFSAALYKMNPVWTRDLSAVYYALNCDAFATRGGLFLRQFPLLMQAMTAGTMFLEFFGPLLVLLPWGTRWLRLTVALSFMLFHLGLVATMTLGLFPWICIAGWMLFLPGELWESAARGLRRIADRRPAARSLWNGCRTLRGAMERWPIWSRAETPVLRPRLVREVIAALLLLYAFAWNLRDLADDATGDRYWPRAWNRLAVILGLEKGWSMFAPIPHRDDGWPIFRGTLQDGTVVNLWEPGRPLPLQKPPVVSDLYHSQRWRRCLENLMAEGYAWHRPYFADWLQRRWDTQHAQNRPERKVALVEIMRRLEPTPPPGEPFLPVETVTLWTKWYPPDH